jgi:hypothetical protein
MSSSPITSAPIATRVSDSWPDARLTVRVSYAALALDPTRRRLAQLVDGMERFHARVLSYSGGE